MYHVCVYVHKHECGVAFYFMFWCVCLYIYMFLLIYHEHGTVTPSIIVFNLHLNDILWSDYNGMQDIQ